MKLMALKNRLRVILAEEDIKQTELADAVGVSRNTIGSICNRNHKPDLETAIRIARYLSKKVEDIWELE